MAYFKSPFGFPSITPTTPGVNAAAGTEPVDTTTLGLPTVGTGEPQLEGGLGNPYVGSGWTNLSNFLNKDNVAWGTKQQGEPGPMDPVNNRTNSQSNWENWMWQAGGRTPAPPKPPENPGDNDNNKKPFIDFSGINANWFKNGVDLSNWGYHPMGDWGNSPQQPQDTGNPDDETEPRRGRKQPDSFPALSSYLG